MVKFPTALVELLEFGVGTGSAGLKPAMITGSAGLVTSSTVIQVASPKPVISLKPLIVTGPATTGNVLLPVPGVVGPTVIALLTISGARLIAKDPWPYVAAIRTSGSAAEAEVRLFAAGAKG